MAGLSFSLQYLHGYLFAMSGAVILALYSVRTRDVPFTPDHMFVFYFCAACLFLLLHLCLEETALPASNAEWAGSFYWYVILFHTFILDIAFDDL